MYGQDKILWTPPQPEGALAIGGYVRNEADVAFT